MIQGFEKYTHELNDDELLLLPVIIESFSRLTIDRRMQSNDIVKRINEYLIRKDIRVKSGKRVMKMTGERLRKFVNYIRSNSILPILSTSKGYWVDYKADNIKFTVDSLRQRAKSIQLCADGLESIIHDQHEE